jgi:hypothetical protein
LLATCDVTDCGEQDRSDLEHANCASRCRRPQRDRIPAGPRRADGETESAERSGPHERDTSPVQAKRDNGPRRGKAAHRDAAAGRDPRWELRLEFQHRNSRDGTGEPRRGPGRKRQRHDRSRAARKQQDARCRQRATHDEDRDGRSGRRTLKNPPLAVAQKNGWLSDVRHTAAIVYTETGPKIIVVLSYRPALSLREAQGLGRRVVALVNPQPIQSIP